jgi:YHS domain-containing protein
MTRNIFIFLGTFAVGALVALVVRAAAYNPHAGHESQPAGGGDYAPLVTNPLAPATPATPASTEKSATTLSGHEGHSAPAERQTPSANADAPNAKPQTNNANASAGAQPVNTVCAICGMAVDPKLPTMEYQGKTIGFGCKMCAPKFKADPDRYGPAYLRNEVIKR